MDVAFGDDSIRQQALASVDANPADAPLWARRTLLSLIDAADSLQDLRTTTSVRLARLDDDPRSGFRYSSEGAEMYLYPIHANGEQMSTGLGPDSLNCVRAVKLMAIRCHVEAARTT